MTASPSPKPPTKTARIEGDHYPTPRWAIDLIVPQLVQRYLTPERQLVIEPACGDGAILEVLAREGVQQLLAFELDATRAAAAAAFAGRVPSPLSMVFCADALTESWRRWNVDPTQAAFVIGNPPYSHALAFVQKAMAEVGPNVPIAMLLRLGFLESDERQAFHEQHPCDLYVLPNRPSFSGNGKTDGCAYAWFVWHAESKRQWSVLPLTPKSVRCPKRGTPKPRRMKQAALPFPPEGGERA